MTSRRQFLTGATAISSGLLCAGASLSPTTASQPGPIEPGLERYIQASEKAVGWLLKKVRPDGTFGTSAQEMTCYHKSAYLLAMAGRTSTANAMLSHIKRRYLQPDGDFMLAAGQKRDKVAYNEESWPYSNGWFALSAHRMGRFDISFPAWDYLLTHLEPALGGFTSTRPGSPGPPMVDLISTAHLGMLALYLGDRERAIAAGTRVQRFETDQPDPKRGMFVRIRKNGSFVTDYPGDQAINYFVDRTTPNQFYFTPGYAAAFLAKIYLVTGDSSFLDSAERYVSLFSDAVGVFDTHFAHKLAWGSALLFSITGNMMYGNLAQKIADVILGLQSPEGAWFADQPDYVSLDQTAECGIWLRAISAELGTRR